MTPKDARLQSCAETVSDMVEELAASGVPLREIATILMWAGGATMLRINIEEPGFIRGESDFAERFENLARHMWREHRNPILD